MKAAESSSSLNRESLGIVHGLLSSDLPEEEKKEKRLADECRMLVLAGTLTMSNAISYAVFYLIYRPATLRKLREELFAAMPVRGEEMPLSKLERLPYLNAVIKEALRMSIGASSRLTRRAKETLSCRDRESGKEWRLAPGLFISMSQAHLLYNEKTFPNPTQFQPERWLEAGSRLERYLQVFGGGARQCLGMFMAESEMRLVLARLFRQWGGGGFVGGSEEGDRRAGDVGVLKIFESSPRDARMARDRIAPQPYKVRSIPLLDWKTADGRGNEIWLMDGR